MEDNLLMNILLAFFALISYQRAKTFVVKLEYFTC